MSAAKEERTIIAGPAGDLEVVVRPAAAGGALSERGFCALVCHPHPVFGGTMDNKVVTTLTRIYAELGAPAARFNFRGVGASGGQYDKGRGEVDDLAAVADWLQQRTGASGLLLAGFSFGSGVASNGCLRMPGVRHGLFVAPPVGRYNFAAVTSYPCPLSVVVAGQDELVDSAQILVWAKTLDPAPQLVELPEASHFFHGQLAVLRERLLALLPQQLAEP